MKSKFFGLLGLLTLISFSIDKLEAIKLKYPGGGDFKPVKLGNNSASLRALLKYDNQMLVLCDF